MESGTRLGHYEILGQLGVGGMGEVYRARDSRLDRDVAIKVLRVDLVANPERLVRLEREAKVLAQLEHPNVAAVYGLERAGEGASKSPVLVMQLVEGQTLADRIEELGRLDPDETIAIAAQIAAGLEAAHERGIVHRDLKPANVMVDPDGNVKVLDFGLAKALGVEAEDAAPELTASPTVLGATTVGTIMGTAGYMSPEQARGKRIDKRTDIWAFGCVLWEMLTGRRLFQGETVTDVIAAVVTHEPDWELLPELPAKVSNLLRRCLDRDVRKRLRDIGEARIVFESRLNAPPIREDHISWKERVAVPALVIAGLALALAAAGGLRGGSAPADNATGGVAVEALLELQGPARVLHSLGFALSPAGDRLAFVAMDAQGNQALWLQRLDGGEATALAGTAGARFPFWSPQGRLLGFTADGQLQTVDLFSGATHLLCPTNEGAPVSSWSQSGTILFTHTGRIYRTDPKGSDCRPVTTRREGEPPHSSPSFFPDGEHFAFRAQGLNIYVADLATGESRPWIEEAITPQPIAPDWVLFARNPVSTVNEASPPLLAQRFDPETLDLIGAPRVIMDRIDTPGGDASFSATVNGVLVVAPENTAYRPLVWIDRSGQTVDEFTSTGWTLDESPEGGAIAMGGFGMWVRETDRGITEPIAVQDASHQIALSPAWDPTGRMIAFSAAMPAPPELRVYRLGDGKPTTLWQGNDQWIQGISWSPDGSELVFWRQPGGESTTMELWAYSMDSGQVRKLFESSDSRRHLQGCDYCLGFSPDARWLLYWSAESGAPQVYLRSYPEIGAPIRVSPEGGHDAHWGDDGTIYYATPPGAVMAVTVGANPAQDLGVPEVVLPPGGGSSLFAVSPDGSRFLRRQASGMPPLRVITNWQKRAEQGGQRNEP